MSGPGELLPRFSVLRPVTAVMALLAVCAMGAASWVRIPVQLMPSGYDYPYVWIWGEYRNATPREVERQIVHPVEAELGTLPSLRSLSSRARVNWVSFELEFQQSTDMSEAYNQVADRLDRAQSALPADFDRFFIYKYDPTDEPIAWGGIAVPPTVLDPSGLVQDRVKRRLERVPGVARVEVYGADPKEIAVDFDAEAVERHRVDLVAVMEALSRDDFVLPAGRVVEGGRRVHLRSLGRFGGLEELRSWPIRPGLRLGDVAEVEEVDPYSGNINRLDGAPAVSIEVYKESQANTVPVGDEVRRVLTEELPQVPEMRDWRFHVFFDQSKLIRESLDNLTESGLIGGALAVLVLVAFLRRARMTAVIALSIPVSMLITVLTLYATGGTLNLMSLMGLMLSVGMVVDNSIVVVENVYRLREHGVAPLDAAVRGAGEVALAILASTGTSVVVFLPLIFMGDDAEFAFLMGEAGLPVCYALVGSLLVALVFIPLATLTVAREAPAPESAVARRAAALYARTLEWILARRGDAALVAFLLFLTTFFAASQTPETDELSGNLGDFVVRVELPTNLSYRERLEVLTGLEERYLARKEEWRIKAVRSHSSAGNTRAMVNVFLEDRLPGDPTRDEIVESVREDLPRLPGCELQVGWGSGGRNDKDTSITLYGEDSDRLDAIAREVQRRIVLVPGVANAEVDRSGSAADEVRVRVDREVATRHGLSTLAVARTVGFALRGLDLPPLWRGEHPTPVLARYRDADRQGMAGLEGLRLAGAGGASVPLSAVASVETSKGYGEIRREDGKTSLPIRIQLQGDDVKDAMARIAAVMEDVELPRGYSWSRGRRFSDMEEDSRAQQFALVMSVVLVYLLMGMLFESFALPLGILVSIPFAFSGVYWMLFATGTAFDMMAGIGLVILMGIVVNNAIVLVDRVQQLRAEGVGRDEALVAAGVQRLRPILMTAGTTVIGLVPLAAGDANLVGIPYHPLGRAVIGGLLASTALTLLVVPLAYTLFDDARVVAVRWAGYARSVLPGAPKSP